MRGMDARTGRAIDGIDHLRQSIADILTTPIGSRVMRRDYGSLIPELIDQPFNGATRVKLYGATATALMRWEPRIRLTRIELKAGSEPGAFTLDLIGQRTDVPPTNDYTRLTLPLRTRFV
ncbi:GPW/gp25 family protein [Lysobacter sp. Root604]|uniref:GPW/gp25 family protein n=1 Tax=Lysobacter sp. Root604 TaxID=1736568 RepID=UPI0006F2E928|nr:GPW/gp25 family protein [Lysobacter sp. Root604]KRA15359.1 baseplate assembly protein [Lysobacter sp. Root604]